MFKEALFFFSSYFPSREGVNIPLPSTGGPALGPTFSLTSGGTLTTKSGTECHLGVGGQVCTLWSFMNSALGQISLSVPI